MGSVSTSRRGARSDHVSGRDACAVGHLVTTHGLGVRRTSPRPLPFVLLWDEAAGWEVFTIVNFNVCGSSSKDRRQHKSWICLLRRGFNEIGCFVLALSSEKVADVSGLRLAKCACFFRCLAPAKECSCLSFSEDER